MGNHHIKSLKHEEASQLKSKFNDSELHMLSLIFADLSARHFGMVDKETFLKFFPLTGLWGEQLFKKFDLNHTGLLTFYEFASGMALCCKSPEEEKMKLLFSLYDFDNDGYIEKKEMITMLYNYPRNHIKFITDEIAPDAGEKLRHVTEAKRLASIANLDEEERQGLAPIYSPDEASIMKDVDDKDRQIEDMDVANENVTGGQLYPVERDIKKSYGYYQGVEQRKRKETEIFGGQKQPTTKTRAPLDLDVAPLPARKRKYSESLYRKPSRGASNAFMLNQASPLRSNVLQANRARLMSGSGSTVLMDQNAVQATTINNRVKEYASFMFRNFEGANARGKLSYSEFKEWLTIHPIILKIFENSFHEEIWNSNGNGNHISSIPSIPSLPSQSQSQSQSTIQQHHHHHHLFGRRHSSSLPFQSKKPDLAGFLYKKGRKSKAWKKRYYELRNNFLLYYSREGASLPKGVLFLEGCYIEELNDYGQMHKYGFKISYKTESYEDHCLYASNKETFDSWMLHLKMFKSMSIHDMYQFKERIGTGKFSIVYRAISKKNNVDEYAIKVIEKGGLKEEEREFVLSETTVMKVLNHPSMIKLIETIETKTTIYIVTEIVKDGDLFEYIVSREFLEEYEASYVMRLLLTAIHYLHSVGIVHRDIKPENIMITLSKENVPKIKEIKIIDFGFAQFITPGVLLKETCGTPNYVAPEVLKGNGYDKRVDIWSLGVIMYLMLRGRLPFDSFSVDDILRNTMKQEVPMDEDHWDNISDQGRDLVLRLLERDVNKRITIHDALHHPWITGRDDLRRYMNRNPHEELDALQLAERERDRDRGVEHGLA